MSLLPCSGSAQQTQHLFLTEGKHATVHPVLRPVCVLSHAPEGVHFLQKPLYLLNCLHSIRVLGRWLLQQFLLMGSALPKASPCLQEEP